jgi:predicted DsbA family dithiol-disulfide isomerase
VNWVLSTIGAVVIAALYWVARHFIGDPVRNFRALRSEVIRRLAQFANVRAQWKQNRDDPNEREQVTLSEEEQKRLAEAESIFRDLASQMRAFAQNEWLAMIVVRLFLRYDPMKASAGLFGLSNTIDTYGGSRAFQNKTIREALRITDT